MSRTHVCTVLYICVCVCVVCTHMCMSYMYNGTRGQSSQVSVHYGLNPICVHRNYSYNNLGFHLINGKYIATKLEKIILNFNFCIKASHYLLSFINYHYSFIK